MTKEARKKMNVPAKPARRRFARFAGLVASVALLAAVLGGAGVARAESFFDDYDFASTGASLSAQEAGAHADFTNEFEITQDTTRNVDAAGQYPPTARLRDIGFELPPGMTGNPEALPKCDAATFIGITSPISPQCPIDTQVGVVYPGLWGFFPAGTLAEPLYNLEPPGGNVVARLGFFAVFYPVYVDIKADPARDYALTTELVNLPQAYLVASINEIWGVPTDPSHDALRIENVIEPIVCNGPCVPHSSSLPPTAFMSNPTSCGPVSMGFTSRSYAETFATPTSESLGEIVDCEPVPFEPELSLAPTTGSAGSAAGIDFNLKIPQDGLEDPTGRASAHLRKAVITMPEGVSLNPSAADGLDSCSQAEVGVASLSPLRFNDADVSCPDASKVGTGTIVAPALEDPMKASLYLADQDDNPFDTLLSGYLVAEGKGITIKSAGSFDLDPATGRMVATFDNNPQQPFSELDLHFKSGNRGVITTPSACGTYDVGYELTPWSGNAPEVGTTQFTIDQNCGAGGNFSPGFEAGSASPLAGAFSAFVLKVTREAGSPQLTGLTVDPPAGLTGSLAGIPYCPDDVLSAISGNLGAGGAEVASPSCPGESQIGNLVAGAGSGSPFYVNTGKVYLAGPYKGAPVSMAVVAPAVAGPFDLGNVVVRTALYIDPKTAQIHSVSDPLPTILQGIPLELRDVRVLLDRQGFTINPTDCSEKASTGTIAGSGGASAAVSDRYQLGECAGLGFKPRIGLRLKGGITRGKHPALTAVLRPRPGDSNIASVSVSFPRSEFLENAHIRTICTRVDFAADNCPKAAAYGRAAVITPLLDYPLTGSVYLRSSDNKLPDVVPDLRGPAHQPLKLEAAGRTDSVRGGIRNSFDFFPDAPFTRAVLRMQGGNKGLLVNSRNICARVYRAVVKFTAHNGRRYTARPKVRANCGNSRRKAKRSGHRRASLRGLQRAVR